MKHENAGAHEFCQPLAMGPLISFRLIRCLMGPGITGASFGCLG